MTVQTSGQALGDKEKNSAVAKNYESRAAMAFLQYLLQDEFDFFTNWPAWLTKDMMGQNTMGPTVLEKKAKTEGGSRSRPIHIHT